MEINYIILAHKTPLQVLRLIDRLDSPKSNFYIHIDKGSDITPFLNILIKNNIHFCEDNNREYGTWGDIGIVKATIYTLKKIINDGRHGYCVLLSGQDYPLQSNSRISSFFESNYGTCFMETFSIPFKDWANNGGLDRLNQYKINLSNKKQDFIQLHSVFNRGFYKRQSFGKINKLLKTKRYSDLTKILLTRQPPIPIKPFGGSQWWALPIEVISLILNFIDANPEYISYHENTLLPDEIFFQSILGHLKQTNNLVIRPNATYINWKRKNTPLPVTFTENDFFELKNVSKKKLFARKFDIDIDHKILDKIDLELLQ
ncbi:beta-1,6-N-acetylglucosaminyltransferase [Thalassobellus citreus]|uniref:beta-1,6-N-acetylglucosaminyltransferase n=1 Tax=Thalassobellus citreus TaxID=3367752 RepID=UPI00379B0257